MGFFNWLRSKAKTKPDSAARRAESAHAANRRRNRPESLLRRNAPPAPKRNTLIMTYAGGNMAHADARFNEEEHASFLLGLKVPCRSTWIEAAQWDEDTTTLTLWIGGKAYTFPTIDYELAIIFSYYDSKGGWFWREWRGQTWRHENEFPFLETAPRTP